MIKDKVITFGYGDVLVGAISLSHVRLEYIKPNQEIGSKPNEDYEVVEEIILPYRSDMNDFYEELLIVSENNCILKYRDYIFDFSNYNEKSVNVVKKAFLRVTTGLALAC
ncbi:hypothetical protein M3649_03930 [Ureibacillus chungkukjangi]|uniref:hypothetical protein n=1 Tax=Ureibacillus chungkukjangi TaxID=1202712 RepID=UPI00203D7DD0|nr:hypothetical protein [Ureibacillus chungkukjangi]MCM3387281.1 hypothetical protein [Ureibacillus chungkukjangi]